jgi:hypothetical protein
MCDGGGGWAGGIANDGSKNCGKRGLMSVR